jgi:hypothetical protein
MPRLAERLGRPVEAPGALAKRLRLRRHRGNDGEARVAIDLADVQHCWSKRYSQR